MQKAVACYREGGVMTPIKREVVAAVTVLAWELKVGGGAPSGHDQGIPTSRPRAFAGRLVKLTSCATWDSWRSSVAGRAEAGLFRAACLPSLGAASISKSQAHTQPGWRSRRL